MLSFLRINSLWSPTVSAFSPHFSKPSYPVAFISLSSSQPIFCKSLRNPDFHQFNLYQCQSKCSNLSPQARTLHVNGSGLSIGEIHVILGPMFAGKTSSLLQRIESESCNGRKVAVIKSNKDTRYGLDSIVTHDGAKFQCMALANLSSFKQMFGDDAYDELDVIGIDEAQFFEDLYDFCQEAADRDGKIVVVAGLDGDYLRMSFGSVLDIIPLADSVTKLTARCELCGRKALFTLRKTGDMQRELIGGSNVYMPVCRQHYVRGQTLIETTRSFLEESQQSHPVQRGVITK